MAKASSVDDYKLNSSFDEVRGILLEDKYCDRMQKPLAYWALPNDRRLPLAFLGRTLNDLLQTPFNELVSTAGIGRMKISSLVMLLHRATKDQPPAVPFGIDGLLSNTNHTASEHSESERSDSGDAAVNTVKFDPSLVSEALWTQWRETVHSNGVGHEKLGRLAPTLQALPTVIWNTPLNEYVNYSVSEIRQLKTHGEKRVRVVLEVFCLVHELASSANNQGHLDVRLVPKFIPPIEEWITRVLERSENPSVEEIKKHLAHPLLAQIEIDAGPSVAKLAESRLGINEPPQSVRMQSRKIGVTRARVYQLLDDCSKIFSVRWPEGQKHLKSMKEMFAENQSRDIDLHMFNAICELFYPGKYSHLEDGDELE